MTIKRTILCLLYFLLSFPLIAQETPEITEARLEEIPVAQDDKDSEIVLKHMIKEARWLDRVKIKVNHGVLYIDGNYKNKDHMTWLVQTSEKLPTILAVVNNAVLVAPPVTDMGPYLKEWNGLLMKVKKNSPRILVAVALVLFFSLIGNYLYRGFHFLWAKRVKNPFLASTISKVAFVPVWIVFFYVVLQIVGLQSLATTIIGGTGVAGILFGLAFRGIAENYLSGFLLAMRSPFTQGDHIKINDFQGIVQNLNMRGTTIVDFDGNLILIPNTTVIQSVVQNFSANSDKRTSFTIDVDQKDSFSEIQKTIQTVLKEIRDIKDDPIPLVVIDQLGPGNIMKIKTSFWFNTQYASESTLKSMAISRIKDSLLAFGLSGDDKKIREQAKRNLSHRETDGEGISHEVELQKVAQNSSLPVNSRSANLLKQ